LNVQAGFVAELERRISVFVSLPLKSLDRLSLQKRVDGIGGMGEKKGD